MEHLKLSPSPRRVWSDECILRPTENGINPNLLRSTVGNRDVFRQMPEIKNVGLNRQALTEILGIRLQNTEAAAVAGDTK
jgi:hypothetical protein